jgi:MoaA/NifB/PqqE/SkfB family radical SAM enzyme
MNNSEFLSFYLDYYNATKTKGISIDATNICPLECPACPRQNPLVRPQINNSRDIRIDEYRKIISFCDNIRLCGQLSDPIYHKNFHDLLAYAKKHPHKKFSIHTNGTRKKIAWWDKSFELSTFNVRWIFGLDGTDQETANIYRVNTRFDEVMEVMKLGASKKVNIIWQFIIFKHNEHQIEEAHKMAKENNITLELVTTDRWFANQELMQTIQPPVSSKWNKVDNNGKYIKKYIFLNNENP